MGRITLELLRKRAEHNNLEISTLEEVSLHQENIERIELLNQACRELKILYLQNNLISKIENLSKLKELRYLNLALNNITRIENLAPCESLEKLDLTVNFISDATCVESLRDNRNLRELYLTGNPCTQFEGYRAYVVAAVPQLAQLDGTAVSKSERILATQELETNRARMRAQAEAYEAEQAQQRADKADKAAQRGKTKETWYTDTQPRIEEVGDEEEEEEEVDEQAFWAEETEHTPEARLETHRRAEAMRRKEEEKRNPKKKKPKRSLFLNDRPLNVNEANVDFHLSGHESTEPNYVLDVAVYRFLDTSLIDADVQPQYVRVTIKGKVFQLVLPEDVDPRSKVTGHLVLTMPKAKGVIVAPKKDKETVSKKKTAAGSASEAASEDEGGSGGRREFLEAGEGGKRSAKKQLASIVADNEAEKLARAGPLDVAARLQASPRANDPDFCDDSDVPPLI